MLYTFEFIFIPKVVENSNKTSDFPISDIDMFDSFKTLQDEFYLEYPQEAKDFDWNNTRIHKEMNNDMEYWLITFPKPQAEPQAKWGIIVHYEDEPYKYYTLEKGSTNNYFFCTMENGAHKLIDKCSKDLTQEEFIRMALESAINSPSDSSFKISSSVIFDV